MMCLQNKFKEHFSHFIVFMHPVENVFQRGGTMLRGLTKDLFDINMCPLANRDLIKMHFTLHQME
jgi:hypothetical protein